MYGPAIANGISFYHIIKIHIVYLISLDVDSVGGLVERGRFNFKLG